ncbi:hypothetical protein M2152_002496 [Microbacteriaceae bacterium SG_E_30_P1]|uniref:Septum formation-related domain-containing protein n=1 Tax=Antiquaquibacter oligotrophicus TaxID=2880260 RepID=A0ABT6KR39_9MICO|nr:septum formation family protein [Antiquaquibacter oligotrophicus]MDH6182314.1 hypothetical protein [Antiquaquibacter oligotrophicus]UDF12031.1 septum formation family protein [Antiquaquibacter oligotrophicus]
MHTIRLVTTAAALALVATTALSGCSLINNLVGPSDAVRDDQGEVTESGDVDVFSVTVGDCFNDESDSAEEIQSVPIVPCSEPHDNEIFYEFELPEGDFPGDEAISAEGEEGCLQPFNDFVGINYEDSTLAYFALRPTEGSWAEGDRLIQCTVWDPAGQVTGTLEGAAY